MSLPELPLIDGNLFIDNSSWIEGMSTCHRYLQYKSLNLRILAGEKSALNFGSAIHLALEHRYRNYRSGEVDPVQYYEDISAIFTKFFEEHPPEADDWRHMNWAMALLRRYMARYPMEEFSLLADTKGDPMVEIPFSLPIHQHKDVKVWYSGRIDLPVQVDGQIYVMDHKTTGQMADMFWNEMRMTSQQRGYVWAFGQLSGLAVQGYIVNGIRSKEPPLYVTQGKESKRGGKTTSPEQWWSESFARERIMVTKGETVEWLRNTIDLIEEFFWHYDRGYMPLKTKWCASYGKCPYYDVCRLPSDHREAMLQSGQYTDNTWSPLKQPSQPMQ